MYASHVARNPGLNLAPNDPSIVTAMTERFSCQTWLGIPSLIRTCDIMDIISMIGIIDVIGIIDIVGIITITFSAGSRYRSPNFRRKYRRIDVDQIDHLKKVLLAEYLLQRGRKSKLSDIITIFSTMCYNWFNWNNMYIIIHIMNIEGARLSWPRPRM
jgi:hypothetical protein